MKRRRDNGKKSNRRQKKKESRWKKIQKASMKGDMGAQSDLVKWRASSSSNSSSSNSSSSFRSSSFRSFRSSSSSSSCRQSPAFCAKVAKATACRAECKVSLYFVVLLRTIISTYDIYARVDISGFLNLSVYTVWIRMSCVDPYEWMDA